MWNKPVTVPTGIQKPEPIIYLITLYPFSDGGRVRLHFQWVKEKPTGRWPSGWVPLISHVEGPQVNGIDLDKTYVKIGPFFWSYREYLFGCLWDIVQTRYKGKARIEDDYLESGVLHGKFKVVDLDR